MPPSILEVMLKKKISCSDEILLPVLKSPEPEKKLIQEAQTICKLPAVNPATSGAGERSFSSARRLKTWLPSRMCDLAELNGAVYKRTRDKGTGTWGRDGVGTWDLETRDEGLEDIKYGTRGRQKQGRRGRGM